MNRPPAPQQIAAILTIDCGQQRRDGQWARQPRARYECLRPGCGHREHVEGPERVRAFLTHIRATHTDACPALHPDRHPIAA